MIFSELEFHLNSFDSHVTVGGPTGENFLRQLSFYFNEICWNQQHDVVPELRIQKLSLHFSELVSQLENVCARQPGTKVLSR
jgi:hypothetical protein